MSPSLAPLSVDHLTISAERLGVHITGRFLPSMVFPQVADDLHRGLAVNLVVVADLAHQIQTGSERLVGGWSVWCA